MLPAARERARELAQNGALFPWRTINGEEASAYYAAGTAQVHIDADVAYALSKFVDATGDTGFLVRDGIDILVETARLWADLGFWRTNGSADLPHPRRHRARRVHDRGQQQPVHQRDGALQPRARRRRRRGAARARPRGLPADGQPPGPGPGGGPGVAALRRGHDDPLRQGAGHPPAGRALPRPRGLGPLPHPPELRPAAAALPPAGHLPLPGAQAGRRRPRAVPAGRPVHGRGRRRPTSSTTTRSPRATPRSQPSCSR